MIVVFVVDTSPSMGRPAVGDSGMSRLDLAKMAVEDLFKQLRKRLLDHQRIVCEQNQTTQRSFVNLGITTLPDSLLLLSTARQHPDTAACAAGGRLLIGFSETPQESSSSSSSDPTQQQLQHMERFQRELKGLQAAKWDDPSKPFPEDAGGAVGLNAALSAGLQLLSRYRLQSRLTENFGMGRLPSTALMMTTANSTASALQPACLILITDGACLRQSPKMGGGPLTLQYGSQPLKEFYKEPFRWDQRVYCVGIGGREGISSTQYLHPQLRAMCEVTGGSHWLVRTPSMLSSITENMLKRISPPLPSELPLIPDPLYLRLPNNMNNNCSSTTAAVSTTPGSSFVNGGPICCLQGLENDETGRPPTRLRAMLLYVASPATTTGDILSQPLWCIPEAFFPSKKLDTLPPRSAQPLLYYSKYPTNLGSKSFEPIQLIKMLVSSKIMIEFFLLVLPVVSYIFSFV